MPATRSIRAVGQSAIFTMTAETTNIALHCYGTFAGANCTFEASVNGGDNWFPVEAARSVGNAVDTATGALSAAPAYSWDIECGGYSHVRARATAFTSGEQVWAGSGYAGGMAGIPSIASHPVTLAGATPAGTNLMGDVGLQARANATGAASVLHLVSAASANATSVKASAGRVLGAHFMNNGLATAYVKLHNIATAPTAGTTPVFMAIAIPPASSVNLVFPQGIGFSTGIGLTTVMGAPNNSAMAVAVNEVVGHLVFA